MLSVVLPTYNEEVRLRASLNMVAEYLSSHGLEPFEILCSDDGSRDRSVAIAEEMSDRLPIRVLRSSENHGKGSAVRSGMLAATGDPVFFFDADLSTDLDEIPRFLGVLEAGADIVIGTRKHPDARIHRMQPGLRVKLGMAYTGLVHLMTGTRFSDYTCGFKAFRRAAAQDVFSRCRIDRWSFDAELLLVAHRRGLKVVEVPVTWTDEPDSRVRVLRDVAASFWELLVIRWYVLRGRYD